MGNNTYIHLTYIAILFAIPTILCYILLRLKIEELKDSLMMEIGVRRNMDELLLDRIKDIEEKLGMEIKVDNIPGEDGTIKDNISGEYESFINNLPITKALEVYCANSLNKA